MGYLMICNTVTLISVHAVIGVTDTHYNTKGATLAQVGPLKAMMDNYHAKPAV
jgi:hypothetical protein